MRLMKSSLRSLIPAISERRRLSDVCVFSPFSFFHSICSKSTCCCSLHLPLPNAAMCTRCIYIQLSRHRDQFMIMFCGAIFHNVRTCPSKQKAKLFRFIQITAANSGAGVCRFCALFKSFVVRLFQ